MTELFNVDYSGVSNHSENGIYKVYLEVTSNTTEVFVSINWLMTLQKML